MAVRVAEVGKKVKTKGESNAFLSLFSLFIFQRGRLLDRYGFGSPAPEQAKAFPMPADESLGLDDGQRLSPGEPSGKYDESQLRGSLRPARLNLALQIQSQLLAKQEVRSGQSAPGSKTESDKPQGVQQ